MTEEPARGRLFVVIGAQAGQRHALAEALARRSRRAVAIEGSAFDAMVLAGREEYAEPPTVAQVKQLFLRWSASIATAETYLLEGFDAIISDAILGRFLDDFLDLVTPEPVHLVGVQSRQPSAPALRGTPRYGLWVDLEARDVEEVADEVMLRLDEALVLTEDPTEAH